MNQHNYIARALPRGQAPHWIYVLVVALALSGCVRNEDALDSSAATPPGTIAPPPGTTPPPDDPPPMDPPPDDMPPPVDPDPPIDPPPLTDVMAFEQTLYPLLRDANNFCVNCHGVAQIPTFAVDDVDAAYNVIISQQKVDLDNPMLSRIYLRPAEDRHNCGGDASCDRVAADFLAAIQAWAQQAPPPDPMAQVLVSVSTDLAAGLAGGTARTDANAIAMFTFEEGTGDVTLDTSGVGAAITLQIEGMEWLEAGSLKNVSGKAQASLADSRKLFDMIMPAGEFSIEAWIIPEDTAQDGPARIVSYSQDTQVRNFTMGQSAIYYDMRNRSAGTGANGTPSLEAQDPQTATVLQHVVMTFDPATGRKVYINGQLSIEENVSDTLAWTDDQIFVIGNEVTDNRLWMGTFKMVAIHNSALASAEVQQNFDAGTDKFVTLRFDVSSIIAAPAFIDIQVAQLDAASYVFAEPVFVSDATGIRVKNIRIAVNDSIPVAAQAFRRIDMTVMQNGTLLSPLGAVIPVALGPDVDQFHLEFEVLGGQTGLAEPIAPASPPPALPDVPEPELGIRTFSQINDTMSILTGIDPNSQAIDARYGELRDSLPATSDLLSFSAAQQIAIQRLATTYCGEIVSDNGRCTDFFGDCQIDGNAKDQVADALYDKLIGVNIANQPDRAGVTAEIVSAIDDLGCANGCSGGEAQTVLNATCAAVLSNSALTIN